ncbi:MAG TPA: hypothetical protein VGB63_09310 [Pedobacter sp.]|jgi:hypothetical protein
MKLSIFNPYTHIAGSKALLIGLVFVILTTVVGYYSNVHFDGALDAHSGKPSSISIHALQHSIAWGSVVLIFSLAGLILTKSRFRFIDIAGTIAMARAPMLLVALLGFAPALHHAKPGEINNSILLITFVMIFPVIWMIALMYNAFTTSINAKGAKAVIGFIVGVILAEVLSKVLNQQLNF